MCYTGHRSNIVAACLACVWEVHTSDLEYNTHLTWLRFLCCLQSLLVNAYKYITFCRIQYPYFLSHLRWSYKLKHGMASLNSPLTSSAEVHVLRYQGFCNYFSNHIYAGLWPLIWYLASVVRHWCCLCKHKIESGYLNYWNIQQITCQ